MYWPMPGNARKRFVVVRNDAVVVPDHDLCGSLKIARAAVVAEAGPQRQNLLFIRVGQRIGLWARP